MREYQARTRRERILYSWISIALLFFTLLFLVRTVWSSYRTYSVAKEERIRSEYDVEELKKQKEDLEAMLLQLQTQRGLEAEYRKNYNLGREGEEALIIVDEQ